MRNRGFTPTIELLHGAASGSHSILGESALSLLLILVLFSFPPFPGRYTNGRACAPRIRPNTRYFVVCTLPCGFAMKVCSVCNSRVFWGIFLLSVANAWSPLQFFRVRSDSRQLGQNMHVHRHQKCARRLHMSQSVTVKTNLRSTSTVIRTAQSQLLQDPFLGFNNAFSDSTRSFSAFVRAARDAIIPEHLYSLDQILSWMRLELAPWFLSFLAVSVPSALLGRSDAVLAWICIEAVFIALCASAYPQMDRRLLPAASAVAGKVCLSPRTSACICQQPTQFRVDRCKGNENGTRPRVLQYFFWLREGQ
jgi:hypothetical protein